MASRPLVVAAIAGALLAVSIGVDAAMNRSWTLDVQTPDGWRTLATQGDSSSGGPRMLEPLTPLSVERNGTVHLRVSVDNGYAWSYGDAYRVLVNGAEVTRGTLQAPARGSGVAEFDVPARLGLQQAEPSGVKTVSSLSLEVRIGSQSLYGYVPLQEASG